MTESGWVLKKILLVAEQSLESSSGAGVEAWKASEEAAGGRGWWHGVEDLPLPYSWPAVRTPNRNHMILCLFLFSVSPGWDGKLQEIRDLLLFTVAFPVRCLAHSRHTQ